MITEEMRLEQNKMWKEQLRRALEDDTLLDTQKQWMWVIVGYLNGGAVYMKAKKKEDTWTRLFQPGFGGSPAKYDYKVEFPERQSS